MPTQKFTTNLQDLSSGSLTKLLPQNKITKAMSLTLALAGYGIVNSRAVAQSADCSGTIVDGQSQNIQNCQLDSNLDIANNGSLYVENLLVNNASVSNFGQVFANDISFSSISSQLSNIGTLTTSVFNAYVGGSISNYGTMTLTGNSYAASSSMNNADLGNSGELIFGDTHQLYFNGSRNSFESPDNYSAGNINNIGEASLTNNGALKLNAASLVNGESSTVTNNSYGLLSLQDNSLLSNQGDLTNNGYLNQYGNTRIQNTGSLNNAGTLTAFGPNNNIANSGSLNNSGNLYLEGSTGSYYGPSTSNLDNSGSLTNTGLISIQNASMLTNQSGGQIVNQGQLETYNAQINNSGSIYTNGRTVFSNAYVYNNAGATITNASSGSTVFSSSQTYNRGTIINNAPTTDYTGLLVRFGSLYSTDGGSLINNGGMYLDNAYVRTANGATLTNNGQIQSASYGVLANEYNGTTTNSASGQISLSGSSSIMNFGQFNNAGNIRSSQITNNQYFDNTGRVETALLVSYSSSAVFANYGSLSVNALPNAPVYGVGINLQAGSRLSNAEGGSVYNQGELTLSRTAQLNNYGDFVQSGNTNVSDSMLVNDGEFTQGANTTAKFYNSELINRARVINNGSMTLYDTSRLYVGDSGSFINNGSLNASRNAVIDNQATFINNGDMAVGTIVQENGGFVNIGSIEANSIDVGGGTFIGTGDITVQDWIRIGSGATISAGNSPGTMNITGDLDLFGTLLVEFESSEYDQLFVSDTLTFDTSTLFSFNLSSSFNIFDGASFDFLTAGSFENFDILDSSNYEIFGLMDGFNWSVSFDNLSNALSLDFFEIDNGGGNPNVVSAPNVIYLFGLLIPVLAYRNMRKS